MAIVTKELFIRPKTMSEDIPHYCPGCSHGTIHKMLAAVIGELGIQKNTIIIGPVGCAVLIYDYIDCDSIEAAHGRAHAVGTGLKRAKPDSVVISYQGDGDLLAIGMGETVHAANRGENFTVIFVNNAIYGMTGGQMAPTSLVGQKTSTSMKGRNAVTEGFPIRACELLDTLEAPYFIERCKMTTPKDIIKTKGIIKKAIQYQMEGRGYSFVEILSNCPTNWGKTPYESNRWIDDVMSQTYPIKNFRDKGRETP